MGRGRYRGPRCAHGARLAGLTTMSFIDWSDSEAMFGLLLEYVADEHSEASEPTRRAFLSRLTNQLQALLEACDVSTPGAVIGPLRAVHQSIPGEFLGDPVVEHLGACVEELERLHVA